MFNTSGFSTNMRKHAALSIMLLVGLVILGLAVHRAATASFTHDEAYSYNHFIGLGYTDIVMHKEAFTNNHLLNTFGMKLSRQFFGSSELALRLPNLLALVIFLFYSVRLLMPLPRWLAVCGFIVLVTNSYMLEMFTLARGYGLSIGFMLMALYHVIQAATTLRKRDVVLFNLAALLATLSNFTLINVHIAGLVALYVILLTRVSLGAIKLQQLRSVTLVNVAMTALTVVALWNPIRKTLQFNALDFGGKRGFFESTAYTWLQSLSASEHLTETILVVFDVVIVAIVLGCFAICIKRYLQRDSEFFTAQAGFTITVLMLVLTCLAVELQHALFSVDRLYARFALFLVPLLVLTTVQLMAQPFGRNWGLGTRGAFGVVALWGVFTFARTFGPYKSVEWQYDVRTKDAAIAIARDLNARHYHGPLLHVGIHWLFEPGMNYYRGRLGLHELQPFDRDSLTTEDGYRLVFQDAADASAVAGYSRMETYGESATVLLRRDEAVP